MFRIIISCLCFLGATIGMHAQNPLNDYKYIVIPNQFDFLSGKDRFQINSLTKFLFNKNGYKAYLEDDQLPEDLFKDRCLAAYADVNKVKGGFLKTQLQIELKDCRGNIILTSDVGRTKEKNYDKAYNLAVRAAFISIAELGYTYQPKDQPPPKIEQSVTPNLNEPIEPVVVIEDPKIPETKAQAETVKPQYEMILETKEVLYAQKFDNGYQLVNAEPRIVMVLLNTSEKDKFSVKDKEAMVYKKDGKWIYVQTDNGEKTETIINIKF